LATVGLVRTACGSGRVGAPSKKVKVKSKKFGGVSPLLPFAFLLFT